MFEENVSVVERTIKQYSKFSVGWSGHTRSVHLCMRISEILTSDIKETGPDIYTSRAQIHQLPHDYQIK